MWKFTPVHQVTDIFLHPLSTRMPKLRNDMLQAYVHVLAFEHSISRISLQAHDANAVNVSEVALREAMAENEVEHLRKHVKALDVEALTNVLNG